MHLWQAIKMAGKSLWSNKLRSFLTMLGIIIGVVTVTLLTSVAQGVSNVVVSSIRKQSTLAVFMNMSSRLTFSEANSILKESQPEDPEAQDYFEYSLIYTASSIVANEAKENIEEGGLLNYLTPKDTYTLEDFPDYDKMTEEEQAFVQLLLQPQKHNSVYGASIYAVDDNFKNVYEMDIDGNYFENQNEILVDSSFIKTYFGKEATRDDVIDSSITLGINNYTRLAFGFSSVEEYELKKEAVINMVTSPYSFGSTQAQIQMSIIKNSDGSEYSFDPITNTMLVNIRTLSYMSNEELGLFFGSMLAEQNIAFSADDIYDDTTAKTYKIVGIISDDTVSILSSMNSISSNDEEENNSVLITYMRSLSNSRGTIYMLYGDENAQCFGEKDVGTSTASLAYLRYKSEKKMNSSTTSVVLSFAEKGYQYMSDFMLVSFSSVANIMSKIMNILTIMLTVISVISLIVGGIGIMNIMLVAVTERTREIGIRKSIGAKKSSILVQFLVEALMLSIVGGIIGLGISAIGIVIISHVMDVTLTIPAWVVIMSVGFCTAIGLIFGMFPAVKASNMQPIDALRRD